MVRPHTPHPTTPQYFMHEPPAPSYNGFQFMRQLPWHWGDKGSEVQILSSRPLFYLWFQKRDQILRWICAIHKFTFFFLKSFMLHY